MGRNFTFEAVALVHNPARYRFEEPRQPVFAETSATVEFFPGQNYEIALADLRGFDRVWLIFVFHLNLGFQWHPKVRPPVSPDGKRYGVFATRSPHRPNPVGLSCVEVESIESRFLHLRTCDLLDGTPVLDVKPYIPEIDAFPLSAAGWRDSVRMERWSVVFTPEMLADAEFLKHAGAPDLVSFCRIQLEYFPLDSSRKRLEIRADGSRAIGCRTWRAVFETDEKKKTILVRGIESAYASGEIEPGAPDPYGDKDIHRDWKAYCAGRSGDRGKGGVKT